MDTMAEYGVFCFIRCDSGSLYSKGGAEMKKLYPGGKKKAFNITYDDGVLQDQRFVALLNRYGIKGTFNLNSS